MFFLEGVEGAAEGAEEILGKGWGYRVAELELLFHIA